MALVNGLEAILVVHLGDAKSRAFYDSLSALEISSFNHVIDWHKDTEKAIEYQNNCHYPTTNDFPWVLIFLPWTHFNYGVKWVPDWVDNQRRGWKLEDQVALLSLAPDVGIEAFTYEKICETATEIEREIAKSLDEENNKYTYQYVQGQAMDSMVLALIENVMMSESYRVSQMKMHFMLNSKINHEILHFFNGLQTVAELQVMYHRLATEGVLVKRDPVMIEKIREELNVDLDMTVTLNVPPDRIPLPVGTREQALKLITTGEYS